MKENRSDHIKIQEMIDCFAENDPLKEMSELLGGKEPEEAALKWFGLAVLHAIGSNAKRVTLKKAPSGEVTVQAEYHASELPSPGDVVGAKAIEMVKRLIHLDGNTGQLPLSLGVREDSLDIQVGVVEDREGQRLSLEFASPWETTGLKSAKPSSRLRVPMV